ISTDRPWNERPTPCTPSIYLSRDSHSRTLKIGHFVTIPIRGGGCYHQAARSWESLGRNIKLADIIHEARRTIPSEVIEGFRNIGVGDIGHIQQWGFM